MVWVKSESKLKQFVNKINEKYQSIKIDFKFSKFIVFMDISAYNDSNNRLQITHCNIPTDYRNYFMLN